MVWFWLSTVVAVFGGLFFLYLEGRRRERRVERDWELALTPKGEKLLHALELQTRADLSMVDFTYTRAQEAQDIGHTTEALRLLDAGCRLIEQYCPSMLRSLAAWGVLSRMVSAMAPVQPLRPKRFQLRQLMGLAYLNEFVHHFLVTTGERFQLRVAILARGFSLLGRVVMRSTGRIKMAPNAPNAQPEWEQLQAARHDVHALTQDSLETFRTLLMSMAAERKGGI